MAQRFALALGVVRLAPSLELPGQAERERRLGAFEKIQLGLVDQPHMAVFGLTQVPGRCLRGHGRQRATGGGVEQPSAQRVEGGQPLAAQQFFQLHRLTQRAIGEAAAQARRHVGNAAHALHAQHPVVDLGFDLVEALALGCLGCGGLLDQIALAIVCVGQPLGALDRVHPGQPLSGFLEMGERDFFFQQRLALRAFPSVTLDGAAHALGREAVGVVLAFDQDEAAVAAVFGVGLEHRVGGGAGAGEAVEDEGVGLGEIRQ